MSKKMLALPRIHSDFFQTEKTLKEKVEVVWANLPNPPENVFVPHISYPWDESLVAQCLLDIEQEVKTKESPLHAAAYIQALQEKNKDFSQNEDASILNFSRQEAKEPKITSEEQTNKFLEKAQQVLIYAYFQEKLILDMLEIESQVFQKGKMLKHSMQEFNESIQYNHASQGNQNNQEMEDIASSNNIDMLDGATTFISREGFDFSHVDISNYYSSLPNWRSILSAVIPFLGENTHILVIDTKMKQDLIALAEKEKENLQEVSFKVTDLFPTFSNILDGKFSSITLVFHFED